MEKKTKKTSVAKRISNYSLVQEYFDYFGPELIFSTNAILPGSLPWATIKRRGNSFSPSFMQAFWARQTCPVFLSLRFLAAGRTSQHKRPHSLFFTDSLSHISSSSLSNMRRPHPIYGPLVSGKSFFHHSTFLLNQRIFRETNWIFSTPAFNFCILFLSWRQCLNTGSIIYNCFLLPAIYSTRVLFVSSC